MSGTNNQNQSVDTDANDVSADSNTVQSEPFRIARRAFQLTLPDRLVPDKEVIHQDLLENIKDRKMAPYFQLLCEDGTLQKDDGLLHQLRHDLDEELTNLNTKLEEAKEKYGDTEVLDLMMKIASVHIRAGNKVEALDQLDHILKESKHLSTGQKVDIAMKKALVGFFHMDTKLIRDNVEKAKELNELGGDWDRRNRLKVYEGAYLVIVRDFQKATDLLLDAVATFTAYEILDYHAFIFYAVLVGMSSLNRVDLKEKVVESPDILSVILEIPYLSEFLNSLYECRYSDFMRALVNIEPLLRRDRFMSEHASYFVREMRIKAYSQFLDAYKTVTAEGMAKAFGVGTDFLDAELSRFIAAKRINARIDKISGVIETTRPDAKNAQYQGVIKHGDMLLNRLQRLSRIINV